MFSDHFVWETIGDGSCSFAVMVRDSKKMFCKNEYNATNLCERDSCPLANSQYATVREVDGKLLLFKKVIERAHMPSRIWEKVVLPEDYEEGNKIIEKELVYWDDKIVIKCKNRLRKLMQYLRRLRKVRTSVKPDMRVYKKSIEKKEKIREKKAESVANITGRVEKELLKRLSSGLYKGHYDIPVHDVDEEKEKLYQEEYLLEDYTDDEIEMSEEEKDIEDIPILMSKPSKKNKKK